jgi:hypothetical protein
MVSFFKKVKRLHFNLRWNCPLHYFKREKYEFFLVEKIDGKISFQISVELAYHYLEALRNIDMVSSNLYAIIAQRKGQWLTSARSVKPATRKTLNSA